MEADDRIPIHDLVPNQSVSGTVRKVTISGAVVDIGAEVDGLLHISELSSGRPVTRTADMLKAGQAIRAWVKTIDLPGRWVTLTLVEPPQYTWKDLSPGMRLEGKVVRLADFGAFVDVSGPTEGLVHVSEMAAGRVNRPADLVQEGQPVTVWVKEVDHRQSRISLTMIEPPAVDIRSLKPGMTLTGKVVRLERFGAFVDVGAGRDGMVHVTEMSEGYIASPSDLLSLGQEVAVRVLEVDPHKGRISLSMKDAEEAVADLDLGEEAPSSMEHALRRAMESGDLDWEDDRRGRRRSKRHPRSQRQAEIIRRTLRERRD